MRHVLFDVPVDDFSPEELQKLLRFWLLAEQGKFIVTPNPEFILLALKQPGFKNLLQKADLSLADGIGLKYAIAALTENKLSHRQTGVDLVALLCQLSIQEHKTVVLLGGDPGMAEKAKQELLKRFPELSAKAIDPGYLLGSADHVDLPASLIQELQSANPDILLVALGQGKQERCIQQILQIMPQIQISVGVGGSFETIAGSKPRAPVWLRQIGCEWFWRLLIEPKRFFRIIKAVIVFPSVVVLATLKQQIFLKALKRTLPELWNQLRNKS